MHSKIQFYSKWRWRQWVQRDLMQSVPERSNGGADSKLRHGNSNSDLQSDHRYLNGEGFQLTNAANGVIFDITGMGKPVQIAWTAPGAHNAFLALPDASGAVLNGKQLFGNFTPQPSSARPTVFLHWLCTINRKTEGMPMASSTSGIRCFRD